MNDVELRYNLLDKAKDTLLRDWEQRVRVEEAVARFENRPPKYVRQPTLHKIMLLAEKWYNFVKQTPSALVEDPQVSGEASETAAE